MLSDLSGIDLVYVLIAIIGSLSIHEAMHGFMAHWLGDDTAQREGRLTLNPLAHIDTFATVLLPMLLILAHLPPILAAKPVPFNPSRLKYDEFGAALVAVAGPVTNLVLAIIAAVFIRTLGYDSSSQLSHFLLIFTQVNVGFFVFNMIPIPPLDGSRLLYAFAPQPLREIMEQIEAAGFLVILFVFILLINFFSGPITQIMTNIMQWLLL